MVFYSVCSDFFPILKFYEQLRPWDPLNNISLLPRTVIPRGGVGVSLPSPPACGVVGNGEGVCCLKRKQGYTGWSDVRCSFHFR